jgi:transcriptional antiterminator NusG
MGEEVPETPSADEQDVETTDEVVEQETTETTESDIPDTQVKDKTVPLDVVTALKEQNRELKLQNEKILDMLLKGQQPQVQQKEEPEIEIKNGKKVERMRNLFPGYLFVEMIMTDEAWYVVRNTPGVTGFIGSSGGGAKPFPVSPDEIETIFRRLGLSENKVLVNFAVNDHVRILNGPFSGLEGIVESMNDEAQSAIVLTTLFGRETPTEISYMDLEKIL